VNEGARVSVRDLKVRLLVSPVLGVLIPTLSGLVNPVVHSAAGLAASYAYFALVALTIWTGNRWIYLRLPRREDWLQRPWRRVTALLAAIVVFTIPVSWLLLTSWQLATGDGGQRSHALPTAVVAIVAAVAVITHVYETVFLLEEWESTRLRAALLEQARLRAELDALSREVAPHFLFNSLHALAQLVEQGSPHAVAFIEALGGAYRYVLSARDRPLVPLAEELAAMARQHLLTNLRWEGAVRVAVDVPADASARLRIPPVTLGELLTNAVKHNQAAPDAPLVVRVRLVGDMLFVENERRPRDARSPSAGVGLANLAERHRLATGHTLTWESTGELFRVRIPLSPPLPF
jgi:hypothetical protein